MMSDQTAELPQPQAVSDTRTPSGGGSPFCRDFALGRPSPGRAPEQVDTTLHSPPTPTPNPRRRVRRGASFLFAMRMTTHLLWFVILAGASWAGTAYAHVQGPQPAPVATDAPADYVIGPEDVLGIVFWREPELSGDTTVRPDGRISLPVIGDMTASGLTPAALQAAITTAAAKYITGANVAVVVRTINSRKIFVTGRVTTPGAHTLVGPLTVLQALALSGGLMEYANAKNVTVIRNEGGRVQTFKFNYKDVVKGKALEQNILLRPGDTVLVP